MAYLKPEDIDTSIWQSYTFPNSSSTPSLPQQYDVYSPHTMAIPVHGRTHKSTFRSMDIPSTQPRPPLRGGSSMIMTASPPSLVSHHSFPSLKRTFHNSDDLTYGGTLQEFKEEILAAPKPNIDEDHKLLSFSQRQDKGTILDSQGQVQRIELSAQIHGMFFLSELATTPGESLLLQPELTCYRRNLFQISGDLTTPRGPTSLLTEHGDLIPIISKELVISASESVDGNVVKLIVIPWKTPPPNSPEIVSGKEQEPAVIPLPSFDDGLEPNNDFIIHPIAYRRLQFRIATANNGRRRELQQHFTLHLNVVATLANGVRFSICEHSTGPIVVRGRSPRNFQARREIPLVGSSSARGQVLELKIPTNSTPGAYVVDEKLKMTTPPQMEVPSSPFTFDSRSIAGSPSISRQPSYSSWTTGHTPDQITTPITPNYSTTPMSFSNYHQLNVGSPNLQAPIQTLSNMPRRQVVYPPQPAPPPEIIRFVDNNPRPLKSPRHAAPPGAPFPVFIPSNSYSGYDASRFLPSYATPTRALPHPEYFPPVMPMWSSGAGSAQIFATTAHSTGVGAGHYDFSGVGEQYVKQEEQGIPANYTCGSS